MKRLSPFKRAARLVVLAMCFAFVIHGAAQASFACAPDGDPGASTADGHHQHGNSEQADGGKADPGDCCSRTLCGVALIVTAPAAEQRLPQTPEPMAQPVRDGQGPPRLERPPNA